MAGSITLAVTGTDNPIPTQPGERKTPTQPTPEIIPDPNDAPLEPDVSKKPPKKKKP
jgi:hypothetical protein